MSMTTTVLVPSNVRAIFTKQGLETLGGVGLGALTGEFAGSFFQTLANVSGYTGLAVRFIGQVIAGGILLAIGRRVRGALQLVLTLAGVVAPAMIIPDAIIAYTQKSAGVYAQAQALSLRKMLARSRELEL